MRVSFRVGDVFPADDVVFPVPGWAQGERDGEQPGPHPMSSTGHLGCARYRLAAGGQTVRMHRRVEATIDPITVTVASCPERRFHYRTDGQLKFDLCGSGRMLIA